MNLGFKIEPRDEFKLFELLFCNNLNAEILNWFKKKRKKRKEEHEPVSRFLRFELNANYNLTSVFETQFKYEFK